VAFHQLEIGLQARCQHASLRSNRAATRCACCLDARHQFSGLAAPARPSPDLLSAEAVAQTFEPGRSLSTDDKAPRRRPGPGHLNARICRSNAQPDTVGGHALVNSVQAELFARQPPRQAGLCACGGRCSSPNESGALGCPTGSGRQGKPAALDWERPKVLSFRETRSEVLARPDVCLSRTAQVAAWPSSACTFGVIGNLSKRAIGAARLLSDRKRWLEQAEEARLSQPARCSRSAGQPSRTSHEQPAGGKSGRPQAQGSANEECSASISRWSGLRGAARA
jgi:hypothetical protein